jgi:thiosulfate/3-mercaptopyruvate sulfurtransferase
MNGAVDDPVVSVAWLASALVGPRPPRVLDVRWRMGGPAPDEAFAAGHVPGAGYLDLETALAAHPRDDRVGGRHPLPDPAVFGLAVRAAGVDAARTVVVMDEADGTSAARAWWLLRHAGHPDVRVLDGGWQAWVAAGGAVEVGPAQGVPDGDFAAGWGGMPSVDASGAADVAVSGVLLDARSAVRFRGEAEPIDPVAGHIPGARNAPATDDLSPEGTWLPLEVLRATYDGLGSLGGGAVAAYCGSGVTAAHTVLALHRVGVAAALYPGSWSDWISDPQRPVATGASYG